MTKSEDTEARIFAVETRFQKKARRADGVPRDQAIDKAQAQIDKVKPQVDDWLDRELQELARLVADVRAGDAEPNWIAAANSRSRQLRDIGTTMNLELMSFVADSLCELLDSIDAGNECNMDAIACHIDSLTLSRQENYRYMRPEQVPELTEGLRRVANRATTEPSR